MQILEALLIQVEAFCPKKITCAFVKMKSVFLISTSSCSRNFRLVKHYCPASFVFELYISTHSLDVKGFYATLN